MLKILIVDDRVSDINKMKELINRYEAENSLTFNITTRSNEDEIVITLNENDKYDFLFLDIYIDRLNGIDLAKKVRENNKDCKIVFFSTTRDAALDAFSVNASQYLLKPVSYEDLSNAMDILLKDANEIHRSISLNNGTTIQRVRLSSVVFCETQLHYQYIYLDDGTNIKVRMSSKALYEEIDDENSFIRVGASYIVNLKYVVSFDNSELRLRGGYKINIPRGLYNFIRESYVEYYSKGVNS